MKTIARDVACHDDHESHLGPRADANALGRWAKALVVIGALLIAFLAAARG